MEDIGVLKGRDRFLKALRKAEEKGRRSQVGGAHSLLLKALDRIEAGIVEWAKMANRKAAAKPVALKWLTALEPETVAYLTVKILLDGMHQARSVYGTSQQIAQAIEDELVYRELRERKPALFEYMVSRKFLTQHYRHNARMLKGVVRANAVEVSHLRIPKAEKVHVGTKCIDLAISVTGLFRVELVTIKTVRHRPNAKRDQWQLIAEPETVKWVEDKNEVLQWLTPMALPMVVPPLPWTPAQLGGYRYGLRGRYDMVRGVSPQQQEVVRKAQMPAVYEALNFVQSTAWRVNRKVLDVVERIVENGGGMAGIPELHPEPLPAKPVDIDGNREARKRWRKLAHEAITRNKLRAQVSLKFHRVLREAQAVADEPTLFFPHNLDFRGRLYPIATHLSPQGEDICKGLLTFAEGKPLGPEGVKALAVHGANCMDTCPETGVKLGQQSLDDRRRWVRDWEYTIQMCGEDPLGNLWWTKAEDPMQFLAFCIEWAAVMQQGERYVCSLPVYVDGSCNGLQHFAAMFRDEVGGAAVNLVPQETPADVYQRVADAVLELLRGIPEGSDDYLLARRWLASGLVTRKLCKRPTMTFGYGSKVFGFQDQILEYLMVDRRDEWERTKGHFTVDGTQQTLQAARMLSRVIWQALGRSVVKAFEGMDWLQRCAKEVCRQSQAGVTWKVPITGFPVRQEYYVQKKRHVSTILAGRLVRPVLYTPTARPLAKKQQNAVSPNVIHSLDAAALMLAARQAMGAGVTSFSAIHDSYGTVPADVHLVGRAARDAFVRLYTEVDVPRWLHRAFAGQVEDRTKLPVPPEAGELALAEVRDSLYFFA